MDGEKQESGSWAGDNQPEPIRPGGVFIVGQDQDEIRGGYNSKQSWVGILDQYEEGVWQDPSPPNPVLTFDGFWQTGQPNGGVGENCARTYIDRRWQDVNCDQRYENGNHEMRRLRANV